MKNFTFLTALLALSLAFKQSHAQVKVEEVLKFKNDQYDFGKINFGKPATYTIEITNISKDTVTLITARPGCGCTTPNFKANQKMAPGQIAEVQITFNGSAMGVFSRYTDLEFSGGLKKQTKFSGEGVAITNNTNTGPVINITKTNKQ
jgi:hypothetical protein